VLGAARSCVALKKELIRKIEASQIDLAEKKSAGIVVDELRCLRAVRRNGAALLVERLLINLDPKPTNRINLSRGRKSLSPDDILEQSEFPDPTLNRTGDLIGRLMVAMGIVSPADKKGPGADLPRAISNGADRPFGLFALEGNEAIRKAQEEHILWFQPELRACSFCLLLAERPKCPSTNMLSPRNRL
jgi:hypothetical protein